MRYENPLPPEGINTTATQPLKELLLLSAGITAAVFLLVMALGFVADRFARYIPYAVEVEMAGTMAGSVRESTGEVQQYLQQLGEKLAAKQELPEEMMIHVHYVAEPTVNAMATLGGHIFVFQGLLQKLESENAIAMVLAHEIAHIKYRHPIQSLGRGVIISLALGAIGIASNDAGNILGKAGLLSALTFSRQQEQVADETALQSIAACYGHTGGATDLFSVLLHEDKQLIPNFTFLSTHPLSEQRIENILALADLHQWPVSGELSAVPAAVRSRIAGADHKQ